MTPRSKYYAIKYHSFGTELKSHDISIAPIDSTNQIQIFSQKVFVLYYKRPIDSVSWANDQNGPCVGLFITSLSLDILLGVFLILIYLLFYCCKKYTLQRPIYLVFEGECCRCTLSMLIFGAILLRIKYDSVDTNMLSLTNISNSMSNLRIPKMFFPTTVSYSIQVYAAMFLLKSIVFIKK